MKYYVLIVLIALIFVSGCVQQSKPTFLNDGIRINSFLIEPTEVRAGQPFTVTMEVENVGQTTASQGFIELLGTSWLSPNPNQNFNDLKPQDPQLSRPGSTTVKTFSLQSPSSLPQGVTQPYTITGRVKYAYQTSGTATITVLSEQEYLRRKAQGQLISEPISVVNTFAPISIDVIGSSPIVVSQGAPEETFYKFVIKNVGSGFPISFGYNGLVSGTISIDGEGASIACFGSGGGQSISLPQTDKDPNSVVIRQGTTATIPCSISVGGLRTDFNTVTVKFALQYAYYSDAKSTLTVYGRG